MFTAYITKEAGKIKASNKTLIFEAIDGNTTTIYPDKGNRNFTAYLFKKDSLVNCPYE